MTDPPNDAWHDKWSEVDATSDPQFYIRFLDATRQKMVRLANFDPVRYCAYLDLREGTSLLDVGCGTGDLLHPIAQIVGPSGRVVGCDYSATIVEEARRRAERRDVAVEFVQGDAHQLPFPDGTFDRCSATAVFQHIADPARALREVHRVLKPGGMAAITEPDWETQVVDSCVPEVSRKIVRFFSDSICHGGVAHPLPALFKDTGFTQVEAAGATSACGAAEEAVVEWLKETAVRAGRAGVLTAEELERWLHDQEVRVRPDRFFAAFTSLRVTGIKP